MKKYRKPEISPALRHSLLAFSADILFVLVIVISPMLGGSNRLSVLPVSIVLASLAFVATLILHGTTDSRHFCLQPGWMPIGLLCLMTYTFLQSVPLPEIVLGIVSPKVAEFRDFALGYKHGSITYELSATLREAAKLCVYAMIAIIAQHRAKAHSSYRLVALAVVLSGFVVALMAMVRGPQNSLSSGQPLTAFANPNHTAGFMVLSAMAALALFLDVKRKHYKFGSGLCFILFVLILILTESRGGVLAGALALGFMGLLFLQRKVNLRVRSIFLLLWLLSSLGLVFSLYYITVILDIDLMIADKVDAFRDSPRLMWDHWIVGIGRGAYQSIYPYYKTSVVQLTFTHPENLLVQYISEWGVIVGGTALLGLFAILIFCSLYERNIVGFGLLAGCWGVVIQNTVDFSLEIPGLAVAFFAVLGSLVVFPRKPKLSSVSLVWSLTPLPLMSLLLTWGAWNTGDLRRDLERAQQLITRPSEDALQEISRIGNEHFSNGLLAAQVSYIAEIVKKPSLSESISWINRALYFDPRYSDAHRATGRLLISAGLREQGFSEYRQAWRLSGSGERRRVLNEILGVVRNSTELALVIPRDQRTGDLDIKSVTGLVSLSRTSRQRQMLREIFAQLNIREIPAPHLFQLGMLYLDLKLDEHAERCASRLSQTLEHDSSLQLLILQTRVLLDQGHVKQALEKVFQNVEIDKRDPLAVGFVKFRCRLALRDKNVDLLSKAIETLERVLPVGRKSRAEVIKWRAEEAVLRGELHLAVRILDDGISLAPEHVGIRVKRVELCIRAGLWKQAEADIIWLQRYSDLTATVESLQRMLKNKRTMSKVP